MCRWIRIHHEIFLIIIAAIATPVFSFTSLGVSIKHHNKDHPSYQVHPTRSRSSSCLSQCHISRRRRQASLWANQNSSNDVILLPDILSIVVATQVSGLVDIVNDPVFLDNGGWLQAPSLPHPVSLLLLAERFISAILCWVASNRLAAFSSKNILNVEIKNQLFSFLYVGGIFAMLLGTLGASNLLYSSGEPWWLGLRDAYCNLIIMATWRYLYQQLL